MVSVLSKSPPSLSYRRQVIWQCQYVTCDKLCSVEGAAAVRGVGVVHTDGAQRHGTGCAFAVIHMRVTVARGEL